MKNSSWISWQPLKCHKWFSWQPCQDHAENPDTSSIVNRYVFKRFLPVVVKTSFVHGVLGNHEKPIMDFLATIEMPKMVFLATMPRSYRKPGYLLNCQQVRFQAVFTGCGKNEFCSWCSWEPSKTIKN